MKFYSKKHVPFDLDGCLSKSLLLILLSVGSVFPSMAASPGIESMYHFFNDIDTFHARFGQVVLDESLEEIDNSGGEMWIDRPGQFRWNYQQPDEQEIVGDGENIWIHDIDLEQVTVRDQQQALGNSPAILLAGVGNLEENYSIEDIGTQGRFDWVNLIPKDQESGFTEIRIGFEENKLRVMEILDTLDQRTRMIFVDLKENQEIDASLFDYVPPVGVDIIDERALQ